MTRYEVEQKYRLKDPKGIRRRLKQLGAKKVWGGPEQNEFFDYGRTLRRKKSILRLRRFGARGLLTFKGPRLRSRYSKRVEIETPVHVEVARMLLRHLGFRLVRKYTKYREEFRLGPCVVTVDRVSGLGWFLEIEASGAHIQKTARKLGLSDRDREPKTYLELLFRQRDDARL